MAITITPPKPGDLITAAFMQQLIDQLLALDARVSQLEGVTPGVGSTLAVTFMEPTDLHIGDELRIHGFNFGLPAEDTVTFDGGSPFGQFKAGSNDRLLIFNVPNLVFAGDSHIFTVAVSNARGSDSRQITIRPVAPTKVDGIVNVATPIPPAGNINPPSAVFRFPINAATNKDETYTLTPTTVQATGWSAQMVTDSSGTTVLPQLPGGPTPPPWQMLIRQNETKDAFVKVTIPNGATTGFVKLDVVSLTNPQTVFGGSRSPDFTIGQPAPTPTLSFSITGISGPGAKSDGTDSFKFTVPTPAGQVDRLSFNVLGTRANSSYTVNVGWKNNQPNGWMSSLSGVPTAANSTGKIQTGAGTGPFPTAVNLATGAGATQAQLQITVTNDADAKDFGVYQPFVGPA